MQHPMARPSMYQYSTRWAKTPPHVAPFPAVQRLPHSLWNRNSRTPWNALNSYETQLYRSLLAKTPSTLKAIIVKHLESQGHSDQVYSSYLKRWGYEKYQSPRPLFMKNMETWSHSELCLFIIRENLTVPQRLEPVNPFAIHARVHHSPENGPTYITPTKHEADLVRGPRGDIPSSKESSEDILPNLRGNTLSDLLRKSLNTSNINIAETRKNFFKWHHESSNLVQPLSPFFAMNIQANNPTSCPPLPTPPTSPTFHIFSTAMPLESSSPPPNQLVSTSDPIYNLPLRHNMDVNAVVARIQGANEDNGSTIYSRGDADATDEVVNKSNVDADVNKSSGDVDATVEYVTVGDIAADVNKSSGDVDATVVDADVNKSSGDVDATVVDADATVVDADVNKSSGDADATVVDADVNKSSGDVDATVVDADVNKSSGDVDATVEYVTVGDIAADVTNISEVTPTPVTHQENNVVCIRYESTPDIMELWNAPPSSITVSDTPITAVHSNNGTGNSEAPPQPIESSDPRGEDGLRSVALLSDPSAQSCAVM